VNLSNQSPEDKRGRRKNLDLKRLSRLSRRPKPFQKSDSVFWKDPYISRHVLNAHLDPTTDEGSRKPEDIKKAAEWISSYFQGGKKGCLLDLGCGPGLYCEELHRLGFEVTGLDFSASSIAYARAHARENRLPIEYIHADYLELKLRQRFDVATLIYGDICVFPDRQRDRLISRVHRALKPNGFFIFDVITPRYKKLSAPGNEWYISSKNGFWHPDPHLVLAQAINYSKQKAHLQQFIVVGVIGNFQRYNIWSRYYSLQEIRDVLKKGGFLVVDAFADLTGSPYREDSEWIGIFSKKMD
jgi:SAM-dependent methyltransferase